MATSNLSARHARDKFFVGVRGMKYLAVIRELYLEKNRIDQTIATIEALSKGELSLCCVVAERECPMRSGSRCPSG
jgi:hypothetical protein